MGLKRRQVLDEYITSFAVEIQRINMCKCILEANHNLQLIMVSISRVSLSETLSMTDLK